MRKNILILLFVFSTLCISAQGTIKTMVYNLWDFPTADPPTRALILKNILSEYGPDIFMVCELQSEYGANLILNSSLNGTTEEYRMAPFIPSVSGALDHQQLIFYRKGMFSLEAAEAIPTAVRDINYYQLKLSTADHDVDPVLFEIFVTHLKSSQGNANKNLRLESVQAFTSRLENMDPNSYVLFSGDLNLYTSTEPAYQELLNPENAITMADPIDRPGSWHENINFQDIHSQSTRMSSRGFGSGAGGGMDDRFDFILISENMLTDPKLRYVPDTYQAFGNNGNCFDNNINDEDCAGFFSYELRNRLYYMSDHLPIVMTLETNKEIVLSTQDFAITNPILLESTLVKENLNIHLNSSNSGNVSFEILNVLGQKLLDFNSRNQSFISIDVSLFANGIYYLKASIPNSPTIKFLKSS